MGKTIKIKKGLDIPLKGAAVGKGIKDATDAVSYGIVPSDFPGYTWKCMVREADNVKIGTPLLQAKEDTRLRVVSPVAGIVKEIHRGERRRIEYVSIEKNGEQIQEATDASSSSSEALMASGLWALMRQRPFDIVADTNTKPRDIFVTAFDSSPLAPEIVTEENYEALEAGLEALAKLTDGKVYVGIRKGIRFTSGSAEVIEFEGPHPAGNVGVQLAQINPVNKGETVWTLDARTAARIGTFVKTGKLDFSTNVAITGPEVKEPRIVKAICGVSLKALLEGNIKQPADKERIISGNVLTGTVEKIDSGFLRYPYRQVTVIEEGNEADEFMGWASMNPNKYSVSRTFPAFLKGLTKPFDFDARIKGGHRAMIMSGEYDSVFPMDIYPEFLLKAIMKKDIEKMEQLGIYEVAPEDFALAEFVDTSKIELQKLVREGLDYLRKETL